MFFNKDEKALLIPLYKRLLRSAGDSISTADCRKLKNHLAKAAQESCLPRNNFDMNPVIRDMQTAIIISEEIGMKRASILGIMLHDAVKNSTGTYSI